MNFDGKVALIVGASSGMGRVLALRLAGEGAHVVVTARRKDKLEALVAEIVQQGGRGLALAADAQDPTAAEQVVQETVRQLGRIDLVVLNAGGAPALDMRAMNAREVTAYMRSNYDVAVNVLFPVLHQMVRQGGGLVAQTNSLAGWLGVPLQGPYSAAKGALRLLIDTCRVEFGPYGIRFVSIYPGFVATEATANDGMPAPLALSEVQAVDHIVHALRREPLDYLFPFTMRWLVRLALLLPKRLTTRILRHELPPVTAPAAGAPPLA
ncbi:short-chain dehydrogenase/reductase SDR [Hydrogenophaga taeniospiralis CCUG 15921]|uniref:Short-chain dehydrogenase/reductase SDR n=1 Tax=Hydrogenophaga taeniospiralis CCUG 15921 TaxID=1281780 RepID=A0A9X4NW28_9BURK|nr:SDR family oxidoreductase [Hydrogenophaga taeniospiralis]MDG5975555.1 short-chain dehydrogenase/reductase SDR [Hydrogenophaga taeniospiralis CCUG 15921]